MMYKNDFVAVIKNNGKILRESGNTVFLPFGAEYSIYMKNLRSRKAKVKISIDGQDVLDGSILIDGNSELNLERFIEDMDKGNKFKFIQKTEKIQEHRGDKIDDGIVRIEFQYEREVVQAPIIQTPLIYTEPVWFHNYNGNVRSPLRGRGTGEWCGTTSVSYNSNVTTDGFDSSDFVASAACDTVTTRSIVPQSVKPLNDEGITVKGSESTQKFTYGTIGILEDEKHVITLQLKGETSTGVEVSEAVTVKSKLVCQTCGTKNDNKNKFCSECGTALK